MNSRKVLIPQDVHEEGKRYLKNLGYTVKVLEVFSEELLLKEIVDCDAIIARTERYTEEVLLQAKKLKVISRHGIGTDNINIDVANRLGITVTNAPLANINSVAEHAMTLIAALATNLINSDTYVREGKFHLRNSLQSIELENKVLGIIGYGNIGKILANKAISGFGMRVVVYDPYIRETPYPIELINNWEKLFQICDFISLHLPLTENTKKLISKQEFDWMKKSAYFINVSRGGIVDENALYDALVNDDIKGAALDVFEKEPPDVKSKLLTLDNVILTPHSAALTEESLKNMSLHAAMGVHEVLSGKKPKWMVNNPAIIK